MIAGSKRGVLALTGSLWTSISFIQWFVKYYAVQLQHEIQATMAAESPSTIMLKTVDYM